MAASIPLATATSIPLPPGFKFKPTDEEIVVRYLRCRAVKQPLPSAFITDKDILSHSPWDLVPDGTSEKYFFHYRVMKWDTGNRWKRGTKDGFRKPSGKEVPIFYSGVRNGVPTLVGLKRIHVFYLGKALAGQRTDWVMEEYSLAGAGLDPYRFVPPSTNQNSGQRNCITDVVGKEHNDQADTPRVTSASMENAPIMLHPNKSWVVCRIHKNRKRAPQIIIGTSSSREEKIRFFDFLGQGNPNQSTLSSGTHVDMHMRIENAEVEGHEGSSDNVCPSNGN